MAEIRTYVSNGEAYLHADDLAEELHRLMKEAGPIAQVMAGSVETVIRRIGDLAVLRGPAGA